MKKKFLFVLILLQMTALVKAQSFEYIYSTPDDEVVNDAVQDSSGNYYLVGYKGTWPGWVLSHTYSALIIKLNPAGDTLKTLIIPPPTNGIGQLFHIIKITDTTFAAIGIKNILQNDRDMIWFLKFDNDLNILQDKMMGDTSYFQGASSAYIDFSNEILLSGVAFNPNAINDYQAIIYRLSLDGDSLQSFYLGDTTFQMGIDVLQLPDTSGYLLFATGFSQTTSAYQIIRLDTSGVIDSVFETYYLPSFSSINAKWLSDSVFITASSGLDPSSSSNDNNLSFDKYDLNFNLLADTFIGSPDTNEYSGVRSLDFINPNAIYGGGTKNLYGFFFDPDTSFYYVIKFDGNLTPQWEKIIGHQNDKLQMFSMRATIDGGVLLAGTRYNSQTSSGLERDIYVVKLDSLGNLSTGINNPTATQLHDVRIYPNPTHDEIQIISTINFTASEITLYDEIGRIVINKKFNKTTSFSLSQLHEGIYFYEVKNAKGNEVRGKVVKE